MSLSGITDPPTSGMSGIIPRKERWSEENSERLIELVKENYHLLTGRAKRRTSVWQRIATLMTQYVSIAYNQ